MPKGSLEYDPRYITPKDKSKSPEAYSAVSVVPDLSPVKNVQKAAEAQSMQEAFSKKMIMASRKGGMTRRRVRSAHKKAVKTGLLGSTAPVGAGFMDMYQVNVVKNGESVENHTYSDMQINSMVTLGNLFNMLDSHPGSHVSLKKVSNMGRTTEFYTFSKMMDYY